MELFVNRENELQLIDESFSALLDKARLLRTPIIEFQGISGIGKTSLLKQVEKRCHVEQLPYIWVDVSESSSNVAHEIITQAKKYIQKAEHGQSAVQATKALLQQGPAVMLFDSVDTADAEQLDTIESLLKDLIDDEKLFVVLASKKALLFEQERSVALKLTTRSLQSIDQASCEQYLTNLDNPLDAEVRQIIFEWTRGYPLAMNIMTQAVSQGQDPRTEQGRASILALFTDQIINQEVLGKVAPAERTRYQLLLRLFAVPRRFNLVLMQDLIETFLPQMKRESSLAYFSLPKEINDATTVLNWSMLRAGLTVEEPLRSLLLLLLKSEQPERYLAIHDFLAQTNLRLAREFPGLDRIRYVRECLYHTASNTGSPIQAEQLTQALQIILQEPPEIFQQFAEEFAQDKELKEALGSHFTAIQAKITARQITMNKDTAEE
jgi:hypothetical protein